MEVSTLDYIKQGVFDLLIEKYSKDINVRIINRLKNGGYFLISNDGVEQTKDGKTYSGRNCKYFDFTFTFIWINGNLWQYNFTNTYCKSSALYVNPLELLNNLLK